jgi:hypothetical protein
MNAGQITRKLRACGQFAGVYATDHLPRTVNEKPRLYVVNTDVAAGLGLHWVAFYFPTDGIAEFFDSTGHPPEHYHTSFRRFLLDNARAYKILRIRLQGYHSNTCGQYCIFYAIHRCYGYSLHAIVDFFHGQSKWQNDEIIRELFPT